MAESTVCDFGKCPCTIENLRLLVMTTPRLLLQFPPAVLKALDLDKIPLDKRYPDSPHPRKRQTNEKKGKPVVKLPPIKEEKKKPFKP